MIRTLADQYLAQNAGRRYPFADDADTQGIPDNAILDFHCTIEGVPSGTTPRAWLTNVGAATENGVAYKVLTVTVERPGTPDSLEFRVRQDKAAGAPYTAHARNDATGARGSMTVSAAALGLANEAKSVPFARTTVVCDSLKVHSIQSVQGEDAADEDDPAGLDAAAAVSGEIALAEGRNAEPYLDGNRLRLDIFKGAGLGERCQSAVSGGQRCGTVLFTVNGERPGSDGDIRIVGDGGITVTPDPENHAVEIRMDDEAARRMADGCAPACPAYVKKASALTFDVNGGSGTMTTGKVATYGQAMPTGIALPTRAGYTFNGFFDDTSGGTKYYNADGTSARSWDKDTTSGTRLYAQWTANRYRATFDKGGGTGGDNYVTATYAAPMPTPRTAPTKTGYTFGGYWDGEGGTGNQYYDGSMQSARNWDKASDAPLYAKWTANTYTVTLGKNNGTGGSNQVTATYGQPMPAATAPTKSGYVFEGYWTTTGAGGVQYYDGEMKSARNWDKAANTTLWAKWTAT